MEVFEEMKQDDTRSHASRNAEDATLAIVKDLEQSINGDPGYAVIYGNSALAAVEILFRRHGITKELSLPMYRQYWKPVVDEVEPL